jgi:class 3 adenylate cyclase/pimeloyl-ACP methyl ester carboxylesterase
MPPVTQYASFDGVRIAYQVFGEGPVDLVLSAGSFSHIDVLWEDPAAALFLTRLATSVRVIRYDRLGTSNSDPLPAGLEAGVCFARELEAVLDTVGTSRAVVLAMLDAGPYAIQFAAENPARVSKLILYNTSARLQADDDYEIGITRDVLDKFVDHLEREWGTEDQVAINVPSRVGDSRFSAWYAKYVRSLGTPTAIVQILRQWTAADARNALARLTKPTLVMHRAEYAVVPASHARYMAERITGAAYVEVPGRDGPLFWETPDLLLAHIRDFVVHDAPATTGVSDFATILFTDIVRSTEIAGSLGDRDWSSVIDVHREIADSVVAGVGGRVVKWTGDGILAIFPDPDVALVAARELDAQSQETGIAVRIGLHTGRVAVAHDDVAGLAVHIAARVMAAAHGHQIVVSRTVRDLMLGSGYGFRNLGAHELKGVEGAWELYEVVG